jgi:uncharacterized protein (TIGR00251 family)
MDEWAPMKTKNGIQFKIKVQPRSSKNEISGIQGDALKVKLIAPPVDGEANEACIRFLSKIFAVPRKRIKIISGQTSPHKIIEIENITEDEILGCLRDII